MSPTAVDIGRGQVVETLVVAPQVLVIDELGQTLFDLTWQVVVLEQDVVLHGAVVVLDLAPGHRVIGACHGYVSCRAPRARARVGRRGRTARCRSVAAADAGPGRAPTRNCAGRSSGCQRHRWRSWWCTASMPGCSARSRRARSTDRTSPNRSPAGS